MAAVGHLEPSGADLHLHLHLPDLHPVVGIGRHRPHRSRANNGQHLFWECTEAVWNNRGARATLFDGTRGRDRPDPVAPLQHGRVINTTQIAQDIAAAGPVAGVSQPSSPVKWTLGSNGGEIFWREFGPTGAAFHSSSPTPQPPGTPVPEAPVLKVPVSIYRKFVDLGGVPALGRPLSRRREVPVADPNRQALRQDFDGGAISAAPRPVPTW